MTIVTSSFDIDKINVSFSRKYKHVPPYACFSRGSKNMPDIRDTYKTLTQAESWLFWTLCQQADVYTNLVAYSRSNLPKGALSSYTRVIKSLIDKELILRIKKDNYMISPYARYPVMDKFNDVIELWASHGGTVY